MGNHSMAKLVGNGFLDLTVQPFTNRCDLGCPSCLSLALVFLFLIFIFALWEIRE